MITTLRSSTIRLIVGGALAATGLGAFLLALPSANDQLAESKRAAAKAQVELKKQKDELADYQREAERIRTDRKAMEDLLRNMPVESVGKLHWRLSQKLFELAEKNGARLVAVKYGAPAREGAKGSLLESLDVEFTVTGVFGNLKTFMLALEGSKLPFAVVSAKLDEAPEGAHLTVVLRAFRQGAGSAQEAGEGA